MEKWKKELLKGSIPIILLWGSAAVVLWAVLSYKPNK